MSAIITAAANAAAHDVCATLDAAYAEEVFNDGLPDRLQVYLDTVDGPFAVVISVHVSTPDPRAGNGYASTKYSFNPSINAK